MTSVYFAEDSPTIARVLQSLLEGAPDLTLAGVGRDGLQAKADLEALQPDILVTDLHMPGMDGFQLIQWVMAHQPIPIVVLSDALDTGNREMAMRCLGLGAMEARVKPKVGTPEEWAASRENFKGLLRALAHVKPIKGTPQRRVVSPTPLALSSRKPPTILAVGASTGGPPAILSILGGLGAGFSLPVLLAIHMEKGFMESLGQSLSRSTGWPVRFGAEGEIPRPGVLYLPAEGQHLLVDKSGRLTSAKPDSQELLVPSVDLLFHSLAEACGEQTCALLLTGMGRDGAEGLRAIRNAGGLTFAQSQESCVVFGMPKAAADIGAAQGMLSPLDMVATLKHYLQHSNRSPS